MSRITKSLLILLCCVPLLTFAADFKEDVDYKVLDVKDGSLTPAPSKISVVEFFSPGCPWCFKLESSLEPWLKRKPSDVEFSRVPLAFENGWDMYQRAYFIAEALNETQKIVPYLFKVIHVDNQKLTTRSALKTFFVSTGVDPKTFDQLYDAPSMDLAIYHANDLMNTYKVYSIPTFIINGKYETSAGMAQGDSKRLMQIVDYLIQKARG